MIPTVNNANAVIKHVLIRDVVRGAQDYCTARIRIESEVSAEDLAQMPFGRSVTALVDDAMGHDDDGGPNQIQTNIAIRFDPTIHRIDRGDGALEFIGEILGKISVKIVEGVPSVAWTTETRIKTQDLASLAVMVNSDLTTLTTSGVQLTLMDVLGDEAPTEEPEFGVAF